MTDPDSSRRRASTTTRSTKRACGRGGSTTTSARTASARTCRSRSPPRGSAARRSITCCSTARPGLGKTTLAYVIANELGVPIRTTAGPGDREAGRSGRHPLEPRSRAKCSSSTRSTGMSPAIEEILYPAMEDFELDIVIGQGPGARSVKVPVETFTLVGATTRAGLLTSPLRARFGIVHRLDFYTAGRHRGDRPALGAHPRRADRRRRGERDCRPRARHAAHRQPAAAARARLRAGPRRRPHHARRGAQRR